MLPQEHPYNIPHVYLRSILFSYQISLLGIEKEKMKRDQVRSLGNRAYIATGIQKVRRKGVHNLFPQFTASVFMYSRLFSLFVFLLKSPLKAHIFNFRRQKSGTNKVYLALHDYREALRYRYPSESEQRVPSMPSVADPAVTLGERGVNDTRLPYRASVIKRLTVGMLMFFG